MGYTIRWLTLASVLLLAATMPASGAFAGALPATTGTFTMTSEPGDFIGQGQSYSFSADQTRIDLGERFGEALVVVPSGDFWTAILAAPGQAPLAPGVYDNAQRFADATHPGLDVFGAGRGCNTTSGSFTVLSVSYGPHGYLQSLHATFEQRCGVATAALHGEIDLVAPPAPAPLEVHLTFDSEHISLDKGDGTIKLRGTITCSQPVNSAPVGADITQQTRKGTAFGGGSVEVACSQTPTPWLIRARSLNGVQFAQGAAQISLTGQAIDDFYTAYHGGLIVASDSIAQTVDVKPGG